MAKNDQSSVRQLIKQYGGNGNISKRELAKIENKSGKSQAQIIKQLDKVNTNKDLTIGLGTAAVKNIVNSAPPKISDGGLDAYGSGTIGKAVANYWSASNTPEQRTTKNGGSAWTYGGPVSTAQKQSYSGLTPLQGGAYQIDSKGNYSPKISNPAYLGNTLKILGATNPASEPTPSTEAYPNPTPETAYEPILPEEPEKPEDPGVGMMSGGGLGATGANKLGRAKSRLRKLGIYGRGTGLLGRGLQYGNALNA